MKKLLALVALVTSLCICSLACSSDSVGDAGDSSQITDSSNGDSSVQPPDSSSGGEVEKPDDSSSVGEVEKPDDSSSGSEVISKDESSTDIAVTYAKLVEIMDTFANRQNYKTQMSGKTVASVMGYTQTINSVVVRDGNVWKSDYTSDSTLVNLLHNLYTQGDKVLYKEKENGKTTKCTPASYREKFGVLPYDGMFGGYYIAQKNVISAKYTKNSEGLTMELTVDGNAVSSDMKVQMKAFGSLDKMPNFTKLTFKLHCADGENLSRYETYAEYGIKKTFSMNCTMNLKTVVSDCSEKLTMPENL